MSDRKRMSIEAFVEEGYLQEANRLFFHPLGLALEVTKRKDGTMTISGVWDARDDPEGIIFAGESSEERLRKARNVEQERILRRKLRMDALGYFIQPIEDRRARPPDA